MIPYNPALPSVTLSSSLRQSDSSSENYTGSAPYGSRVRKGDRGQWISSKSPAQGSFVNYLPQDVAVAAGLGLGPEDGGLDPVESQGVVDLLTRELTRLLELDPRKFWREVATDATLHEFLDSFLQFRSRWYNLPFHRVKGVVAGVIVGEQDLCGLVFKVLYRISSNRDPGALASDSLRRKDHEVLLQSKKLLDLTKLLDICAIYGNENAQLTKSLIENAVKSQTWIHDSLKIMLPCFLDILYKMQQSCTSSLENANSEDHGHTQFHSDLLEFMDFVNDGVVSLDAFVSAYPPSALILACPVETSYGSDELLHSLFRLHDSLLPSLHRGFHVLSIDGDHDSRSDISASLYMLSTRIGSLCWKILDICYLRSDLSNHESSVPPVTKMFPSREEDPMVRAGILIQTLREISGLSEQSLESKNGLLQNIEKSYRIMDRLRSLQEAGWVLMEEDQFQYLSMIILHSPDTVSTKESPLPLPSDGGNTSELIDETAVAMQSKISQIKDIFPQYGNGFLAVCLEAYNQNPEEVIQRILEGTLHADLQRLDISLETMPQPKSAPTLRSKDKGKGKLIEPDTSSLKQPITLPYARSEPPAASKWGSKRNPLGEGRKRVEKGLSKAIDVIALWDKENAKLPNDYPLADLKGNIEKSLKMLNARFVLGQLIAYGPNLPSASQHGIDYVSIPRENIPCQARVAATCLRLVVQQSHNNQVKIMRCTDIADKYLITELCLQMLLNPRKHVLVITGDADFLRCIEGFKEAYFMLAQPKLSSKKLRVTTKAAWMWAFGGESEHDMVYGGRPKYQNVAVRSRR